jgi:pantothenate kinase type III
MTLFIDWGNTYIKICFVELSSCLFPFDIHTIFNELTLKKAQCQNMQQIGVFIHHYKEPKKIQKQQHAYIASVKQTKHTRELEELLKRYHIISHFSSVTHSFKKGTCIYHDPKHLGVDRWLVMLGVLFSKKWNETPICNKKNQIIGIIDIGSAITIDLVTTKGEHLGGQIAPGSQLLLKSLQSTDGISLKKKAFSSQKSLLGDSTQSCVSLGVHHMIKGYLRSIINDLLTLKTNPPLGSVDAWVFTGGGGKYWYSILFNAEQALDDKDSQFQPLSDHCVSFYYDPFLVFKGLFYLFEKEIHANLEASLIKDEP